MASRAEPARVRRAQPWLGTRVEIAVEHRNRDGAMAACDAAFQAVARIHALMSFHDPESELSRLNRAPSGRALAVSSETWQVLSVADRVHRASGGLFDCTVSPCLQREGDDRARASQGDLTLCRPGWVLKRHSLRVDLGGIAKGYAVDCAARALIDAGVLGGLVNAGGDLRAFGPNAQRIEVRDPARPGQTGAVVSLRDAALATSAGYFSRVGGGADSQVPIADPRTGRCVTLDCSITVAAPECVLADALTKVVALSRDPAHPALTTFGAQAWIRHD